MQMRIAQTGFERRGTMNVKQLAERFGLNVVAGANGLEAEVLDGYCGDLLSDVMAHAPQGCIWLTVQGHANIVAVAVLREMAAVVLVGGREPDADALQKADQERIPILRWPRSAYELAGALFAIGIGAPPSD
jgi:predicted transcriptional regulator